MSTHLKHAIHENSRAAYHEEKQALRLSRREAQVLGVYVESKRPVRDREVMHALSFTDMNQVRPAITSLIKKTVLCEVGDVTDPITGKRVRLVALTNHDDPQERFDFKNTKDKDESH
jgi:hypothetical protein